MNAMSGSPLKNNRAFYVDDDHWLPPSIRPHLLCDDSRGVLFKDEKLLSVAPGLFGNHSWYFQTMTRRRYKAFIVSNKFCGAIAPSWTEGKTGKWTDYLVILRPIVFPGCTKEFMEFVREISNYRRAGIIFKQVYPALVEELIGAGCRTYDSFEGWNAQHTYDDQNCAEVVINLDGMHDCCDRDLFAGLSNQAVRSRHRFEFTEVDFRLHSPQQIHAKKLTGGRLEIFEIFMRWKEHFIRRYQAHRTYDFIGWNIEAIDRIASETDHRLFIAREKNTGEAVGFCYLTGSTGDQMDFALSFYDFRENDVHKLLYRTLLKTLSRDGVRRVNMGGSEEYSLYSFKNTIWKDYFDIKSRQLILD
jgi:hypothetical protein